MKKILLIISLLIFSFANGQDDRIPPKPNPPKLVSDFAEKLSPEQEHTLEAKLVAYDDSTSNQIVIVTVNTLNGLEAEQFATELGEKWGVGGSAKFDNGIVILVSFPKEGGDEKRAAFIAIGRGLEAKIPDMTAGHIYEDMVPHLRGSDFYGAFDQATTSLMQAAAGEYKAPAGYRNRGKGNIGLGKIIVAVIILFVILSIFGGDNRGGGYMSRRGYRGFWGPTIFPTGGWGGSSGGGGGFGGFGGGSFGGGGAGGSW